MTATPEEIVARAMREGRACGWGPVPCPFCLYDAGAEDETGCIYLARSVLAALSAAGLVIVPREPTQQMIDAWLRADAAYVEGPHGRIIWRAMIDAAAPVQATGERP